MLEQTIRGTESGLSPNGVDSFHTPNTTGLDGGSNSRKALKRKMEKLPTPLTSDYKRRGPNSKQQGLPEYVRKWPTPRSFMHKDSTTDRGKFNLGEKVGGKLNPTWVEWLMGWPLEWTDLKPLETDKSPCVQQQLGES
jgi:DNA (cytosine-5)-methyltransferase 1